MKKRKKKKSGTATTVILIVVLIVGLSLLLYPSFSNYWNSMHQSKAIAGYSESVATIDDEKYKEIWQAAVDYNERHLHRGTAFALEGAEVTEYNEQLNIGGNGVMGYIEIPEIDVALPIYHGTDDMVLQMAVGHLDWSSLPTGGESTHCVLSGHRGLPSAKLFTRLDELVEGDVFVMRILDEVLTYEVDQIRIVLPNEVSDLQIIPGEDLCTLVTCTPYGINTHRLLVRGHRIENAQEAVTIRITADAIQIEPLLVAPILAVPLLVILIIAVFINDGSKKRKAR